MTNFRTGLEIYKMSLEHLMVSDSKEVRRDKTQPHNYGGLSEGHRSQQKELQLPKLDCCDK